MKKLSLISILALAACGKDGGGGGGSSDSTTTVVKYTIATEAELPACDHTKEGLIAYITSTLSLKVCHLNIWGDVLNKGEKGDTGANGTNGSDATALGDKFRDVFKKYRSSIVKITMECSRKASAGYGTNKYYGSGFICAQDTICTNKHVLSCTDPTEETAVKSVTAEALKTDDANYIQNGFRTSPSRWTSDTIFISYSNPDLFIRRNPYADAAKIVASGMNVMHPREILNPDVTPEINIYGDFETIPILTPVLSMSFPLGFDDLYSDIGAINAKNLEDTGDGGHGDVSLYDFSTTNDTDHGSSGSPLIIYSMLESLL